MYKGIDTQKGIPQVCTTRKLDSTTLLRYATHIWLYAYRCPCNAEVPLGTCTGDVSVSLAHRSGGLI